jgi:hypothetical protein
MTGSALDENGAAEGGDGGSDANNLATDSGRNEP